MTQSIVVRGELPAPVRNSMELWVGCVAGGLTDAGFDSEVLARKVGGCLIGAFVRARKP